MYHVIESLLVQAVIFYIEIPFKNAFLFQSVKGVKSFKTQKKRGGRFGLKRLKEKRKEELVIEGTPPRLEPGEVDVEFSLPKIKQRKNTKTDVDVRGTGNMAKTKRRIRLVKICVKYCNARM